MPVISPISPVQTEDDWHLLLKILWALKLFIRAVKGSEGALEDSFSSILLMYHYDVSMSTYLFKSTLLMDHNQDTLVITD